jgi:hypothetical protein
MTKHHVGTNSQQDRYVKEILMDFGVKTEAELRRHLLSKWNILTCNFCGHEFNLLTAKFQCNYVVCPSCKGYN